MAFGPVMVILCRVVGNQLIARLDRAEVSAADPRYLP
jgi:hypothetical protein